MTRESVIQKQILDLLEAKGIWAWRNYNGPTIRGSGHFSKSLTPGSPDIMGVLPCGRSLQIEVKAHARAKRSAAQKAWILKAQENNTCAFFAWDIDDVAKKLHCCTSSCKRLKCFLISYQSKI